MSKQTKKLPSNVPSYTLPAHWYVDDALTAPNGHIVEEDPSPARIHEVTVGHINDVIDDLRDAALFLVESARKAGETPEEGYLVADEIEATFPVWVQHQGVEVVNALWTYTNYCNDQIGDALGHPKNDGK